MTDDTTSSPSFSLPKTLVFSLLPALVLFVLAEVAIRVTGAAQQCAAPDYLKTGVWICDPILDFRMDPELEFDGKPLNSLGFRGDEPDPHAQLHITTLGDSCTFGEIAVSEGQSPFVDQPYPQRWQALADDTFGVGKVSILNAGVCGYNSYHGVMLLRTKLRTVGAQLVTVQYGWNDLLLTTEGVVPGAFHEPDSVLGRLGQDLLLRTAVYPFARRLKIAYRLKWQARRPDAAFHPPESWTPNVPVSEFEHNLRRIIEIARARGATVWLLTAPDAFMTDDFHGREDAFMNSGRRQIDLIRLGGIQSYVELEAIHAAYNEATRRVARETDTKLVDLAQVVRAHHSEHLFTDLDAIHPNDAGHAVEAEALQTELVASGLLPQIARAGSSP